MRSAFLLGLALATTCVGWPSDEAILRAQTAQTPYEQLVSILEPGPGKTPPANVEQVLQALPDELRSNFTLVRSSRSNHRDAVDPLFPRVVLFTTDGKLLLAFTGNPGRPGYDQLEAIRFDDRTSSFHTSRFILADAIRRDPTLKDAASQNGRSDQFECTRCHGADVRPIFDSYSLWPGFYGALGDTLVRDDSERADYRRFLAGNASRGVYRHLRFPAGSSTSPYDEGGRRLTIAEALRLHPNERLGVALTPLNWKRIVRKLAVHGEPYRRMRYPLIAGMLGCSAMPISRAFDESTMAALETENARRIERAGLRADSNDAYRFQMQELVQNVPRWVSEVAYAAKALGVRRADWSMSFEPSSLGFFEGVLTPDVLYVKEDFLTAALAELASNDRDFAPYYNPSFVFAGHGFSLGFKLPMNDVYGNQELCALLAARTKTLGAVLEPVERIDQRERAAVPRSPAPPTAVLTRCAGCHDGSTRAFAGVEIPFRDPVALQKKLRSEPSLTSGGPLLQEILTRIAPGARNPMPPLPAGPSAVASAQAGALAEASASAEARLSARERRALGDYLTALERSTAAPRR